MLRPEGWTRPAGASPVRVGAGAPGGRPRFVVERRRAAPDGTTARTLAPSKKRLLTPRSMGTIRYPKAA